MNLTTEQVLALAPDASSASAARKLGIAKPWKNLGRSERAMWGECQGSALYQVRVDLADMATKCTCPSRKFPCKHALGMLLLAATSAASFTAAEPPEWVGEWLGKRSASAERKEARAAAPDKPPDPAAQARRAEQRFARVSKGLDALDLWLSDLVRNGLAGVESQPPSYWETQAARLVDSQAPALASRVRRLAHLSGGDERWVARLLDELGRIALLTQAFRRIEALPPALQSDVRQLVGWSLTVEEVAATGELVTDEWVVAGQWVEDEERMRVQRTWLVGARSSRPALILQFAAGAAPFAENLIPGTAFDAELVYWPSASPQRATIRARTGASRVWVGRLPGFDAVDAILASLADVAIERRVLLAAGARAAATMAGRRSVQNADTVGEAPAETRRACSAKAARIVADLLHGHHPELLPEAFALLAKAGQRLPHALLPEALRVRGDDLRAAARPVLGQRGAWLAQMNETWRWVAAPPAAATLDELERAWTEAATAARRELLVRARAIDPARARAWLEATWASEKADERAALLAGLRGGISPADEAFIEAQLRDRASSVREAAQSILPHLAGSAFVRRMTARADAMLDFKRSALAFAGKRGSLAVSPPEAVDEEAERDGLGKPPPGLGARAHWLTRALTAVPLTHWTTRFGVSGKELVASAGATDWASAVCEGWTRAALRTGDAEWLGALWEFFQRSDDKSVTAPVATAMALAILRRMTPVDAATQVEQTFGRAPSRIDLATVLASVPAPWPASLGMHWIDAIHREIQADAPPSRWLATLRLAAIALPPACFARALEPIEVPETTDPFWAQSIAELTDVLRLRHDLVQEIAP